MKRDKIWIYALYLVIFLVLTASADAWTATIKNPKKDRTYSGIVELNAVVRDDNSELNNISFNITNGANYVLVNAEKKSKITYVNKTFNTAEWLLDGQHTLTVYAFGNLGNLINLKSLNFSTDNNNINHAPEINYSSLWNQTQDEDSGNWTVDLTQFEYDVDNYDDDSNLVWSIVSYDSSLINVSLNTTTDVLSFSALPNKNGVTELVLNLRDSFNVIAQGAMTVTINSVNDIPFINGTIGPFVVYDDIAAFDLDGKANDDNDSGTSQLVWDVLDWDNSIWNFAGNGSGQTIVFDPKQILGANITDEITVVVSDPDGGNANVTANVTLVPFDDAPSAVSDSGRSPANNSIVYSLLNQSTLDWQDSTDPEGQDLIYYIFFGNDSNPLLYGTSNASQYILSGLLGNATYYWHVIASDGVNNATSSSAWQFTTDFSNTPKILNAQPSASAPSILEAQTMLFNATLYSISGNNMSYNWSVNGVTNLTGITTSDNEIVSFAFPTDYNSAGIHSIQLRVMDTNGDSARAWLLTVINNNRAPVLNPISNYTVNESSTLTFNISAADADGDALNYSSNNTGIAVNTFNNVGVVSWTPTDADAGDNEAQFTVSDGAATDSRTITITVVNVNQAPAITSYSPDYNDPKIGDITGYQLFSVSANDSDGDPVTVEWYRNGTLIDTGNSKNITGLNAGVYNISAVASDGNLTDAQEWVLTVTTMPVSSIYTGTIMQLNESQLPNATNVTIIRAGIGMIDFGNATIDLSDVVDLDRTVNISGGIAGIDTAAYPQFDAKPATITMYSLPFNSTPIIYYNTEFSLSGNTVCPSTVCSNIAYNAGTGTLTFSVTGFSMFWAIAASPTPPTPTPSNAANLTISNVEVSVDGEDEDVEDGDKISEEAKPGSAVEFNIEAENLFNDGTEIRDIEVSVTIQDIDNGDDLDDTADEFDLDSGDSDDVSISFSLPDDTEQNTYDVIITAEGKDENGRTQEARWELQLEVRREKHFVKISQAALSPSAITCDKSTSMELEIINLGREQEDDVIVEIESDELGIDIKEDGIELDEDPDREDNSYSRTVNINLEDAKKGAYTLTVKTYYDSDKLSDTKTVELTVGDCAIGRVITTPVVSEPAAVEIKVAPAVVEQPKQVVLEELDWATVFLICALIIGTGAVILLAGLVIVKFKR